MNPEQDSEKKEILYQNEIVDKKFENLFSEFYQNQTSNGLKL